MAASVPNVIRRDGVPYPFGEIEHDVIAALLRARVRIPHKRFLKKAFRWAQNANVHHLMSSFDHREDRPNSARPCARRSRLGSFATGSSQ